MLGLTVQQAFPELFHFVLDVVVLKGSALVVTAAIALRVFRRTSAARRHATWFAVTAALAVLPLVPALAPNHGGSALVEVRTLEPVAVPSLAAGPEIPGRVVRAARPMAAAPAPAVSVAPRPSASPTSLEIGPGYRWLVTLWMLGAALLLARTGLNLAHLGRLRSRSSDAPAHVRYRAAELSARVGLRRPPAILLSEGIRVPGTFGLTSPAIVLPVHATSWEPIRLDTALLHELSHIRRRDFAGHLLVALVTSVYWLNPLVWLAARALTEERERACDDGVLASDLDPVGYAEQLLWFARSTQRPLPALSLMGLFGASQLAARVRAVLDPSGSRAPLPRRGAIGLAIVAAGLVVPLASVEILAVAKGPEPVAAALERLGHADADERRRAAWTLGELESARAVDALVAALDDPDRRVRTMSAWALGEIKDRRAGSALIRALSDEAAGVREMAVLALGELEDPGHSSDVGAIRDGALEAPARWALAEMTDGSAGDLWLGRLTRPNADPAELSTYLAELVDERSTVRVRAAERLGRIGHPAAVDALMDALEDPAPEVRAMAVWALDEINPSRTATP